MLSTSAGRKHATAVPLWDALGRSRNALLAVGTFSLAINLLTLTAPLYMLQVFDRVLTGRSVETLFYLTAAAGLALLTLAALDAVRNQVLVRLGLWFDRRLGGALLASGVRGALARASTSSIQSLRDLATFRAFISGPAMMAIMDVPWTPIFIGVIFLLHPILGWLALSGALLLFAIAVGNELATRQPLQASTMASFAALQQAEAAVRNADVVEAMGMMGHLIQRWHRKNDATLDHLARASLRGGRISAVTKFLRMSLQIGILGAGAHLVLAGEITAGAMIAGSILMARALAPVDQAINSWKSAVTARAALRRLRRELEGSSDRGDSMALPAPHGALNVEGVSFRYPGADAVVLRSVGFKLEPGESVGLVGPTASGKSTLARLLVGTLSPQAGHVRLDGADMAQWDPEDRGQYIGYLPQDVELFAGSIRENISRMGDGDADAVVQAARLAGIHEMVLSLPGGYETEIGEGGAVLSGGQRQRVALARALFGNPRLVILDEPNASLDQHGERALLATLAELRTRKITCVVIAHRPNILREVDKILVLAQNTVQMFGPRDEVMARITGPAIVASGDRMDART